GHHDGLRQSLIRRTAAVRTRMPGGVGGVASRDAPLSRFKYRSCFACPLPEPGRGSLSDLPVPIRITHALVLIARAASLSRRPLGNSSARCCAVAPSLTRCCAPISPSGYPLHACWHNW